MQIQTATQEELGLLIMGLRAFHIQDAKQDDLKERLTKQLESELLQRFGLKLAERA